MAVMVASTYAPRKSSIPVPPAQSESVRQLGRPASLLGRHRHVSRRQPDRDTRFAWRLSEVLVDDGCIVGRTVRREDLGEWVRQLAIRGDAEVVQHDVEVLLKARVDSARARWLE